MGDSSKKHDNFVNSPMGQKEVSKLPGIGTTLKQRLNEKGITRAYQVFGQFLVLNKDRDSFFEWLRGFGADDGQCKACFDALDDWSKHHLD